MNFGQSYGRQGFVLVLVLCWFRSRVCLLCKRSLEEFTYYISLFSSIQHRGKEPTSRKCFFFFGFRDCLLSLENVATPFSFGHAKMDAMLWPAKFFEDLRKIGESGRVHHDVFRDGLFCSKHPHVFAILRLLLLLPVLLQYCCSTYYL